jgi:5-carboxymethyl-2-hydroxymuconate isomerase
MPQLRLEYSANLDNQLDTRSTWMRLNTALVNSGLFKEIDIKSRTFRCEDLLTGRFEEGHAFAHLQIIILSGREMSVKADLSTRMLAGCLAQSVRREHPEVGDPALISRTAGIC